MMGLGFLNFNQVFKRIFRYLLKRYLGSYLNHFSSDEISYQLSHGTGKVENVQLNVEALNDLCEEYNLPVEFLQGSIDVVSILIPWGKLLVDNTIIDVKGLKLVVQPKERPQDVSMFDSMWGSMASSLQLAEECIKNENDEEIMKEIPNRSEGLEKIARTIETVLVNTKVKFSDVCVKIEHTMPDKSTGISLHIKIAKAEYFDEASTNTMYAGSKVEPEKPSYEPSAYSFKRVVLEGVSMYTSEFLPQERTAFLQQLYAPESMDSTMFVPGSPEMPPTHPSLPVKKTQSNCNREPVLISKLNGLQELKLKLKQNEAVVGPKVDVEFNFGALNLFLTPQQVHRLFSLVNGLIKPTDTHCDASKKVQLSAGNKPMRPADYALVEQELLRQQERSDIAPRSLKNHQGWSSHSLDESDEDFHLMTMENKAAMDIPVSTSSQEDLLLSSVNSDLRSEASSFSSNPRSRHRGSTVQAILTDPLSELTHFHGCFSSLLVIILHDDSVQETFTGNTRSNSDNLLVKTETFFQDLLDLHLNGFNFKDFSSAREPLSKLCQANHLRLMASGIMLDGNETSSSAERILKFNLSFNQFEVLECLFDACPNPNKAQDPKYMKLISFPSSTDLKEACFKLKYSQVECTSQIQRHKPPANKLDIQFGTMLCDVDISLTDRIRTLLNFNNVVDHTENKWDPIHWKESEIGLVSYQTPTKTEITVFSTNVTINLRFPIPDLRSVHDMERAPWWQQNIHKEILILVIQEISLKTTLDDDQLVEKYEIQVQDIHGLFKIPTSDQPISFLRVSVDPDVDEVSRNNGFDWPRLEIRRMTKLVSSDLENNLEEMDEPYTSSLSYALMANLNTEPSPFESNRVLSEKTKEEKIKNENLSSEGDEIIRPSEKHVMLNFMEQIKNKSEYVFEFTLPTVNIVLPDKDFFELLYNRLASDLALWSNTSLTSTNAYESGFKVHVPGLDVSYHKGSNDFYPVFKPFANESNSESDEEETLYLSVHEYYQQQKQKHQKSNTTTFTKFSFFLNITKGSLLLNSPIEEEDMEIPSHCGKLKLRVEDAMLFFATYYKGDPNESYMCLLAEKSALYHDGMTAVQSKHPVVEPVNSCIIKSNMKKIIYASEPGLLLKSIVPYDCAVKEMLKFSIHIVKNPKQQIKTFKIAIEIAGATLRHYVLPSSQMWINQLINFLKVRDFPINGYIPPAVVTELHLNLSNCAVDYRPLKLPYRTALTVENFNMSCNVTATTPSFLFRIISEELRMFVSNVTESKEIDLRQNYVCVFDSGLIDISIRTSIDEKDNPKLEMSISNNKVHIRTCADSFKALLELVNYLSTNGDMEQNSNSQKETENGKSSANDKAVHPEDANLDQLMAEAMKECCRIPDGEEKAATKANSDFDYCNTDDEFCILEDDPGVGLIPRDGEPQIRMLTNEPIRIIENHFSVPPGKSDVLKAPEGYPNPLVLFTLKTQNLMWNFYGGSDFNKNASAKKYGKDSKNDLSLKSKQVVTFSDQENLDSMALSFWKVTPVAKSSDSGVVQFSMEQINIKESRPSHCPDSFISRGGLSRNHDVHMELQLTKVQFQKEVYPLDSERASRILLYVYDVVIKDKLANSKINKFLYQYSTKEQPKQSNSNMFDLKAVFTRPDPKSSAEECSLKISLKPIRLNVDQDSLMFAVDFLQKGFDIPVLEYSEGESEVLKENVLSSSSNLISHSNSFQSKSPECETFYRQFQFSPEVLIRIDYQGKRIQMEQGALKGLILGLGQLNASEIKLKPLCYRHGLLGHKKLVSYALNEWQQDILKNQLPSLLGGVGPMHSFVQLFQGVKDLFYLPVVHYRRDGQIVRGLQKGATSFSTSTVVAALDLTSRFFYALQGTAEIGFDMVSPGPRLCGGKFRQSQEVYRKNSQPADIVEGVAAAYNVMKEGLEDTARTIYRVASTEHEHKGVPGAVGGVLRQIPPSLFRPIILSSEATSYVLDGARHQLMPDAHQEDIHKWKTKIV